MVIGPPHENRENNGRLGFRFILSEYHTLHTFVSSTNFEAKDVYEGFFKLVALRASFDLS